MQSKKEHGGGNIELSNSESVSAFADKFIVQQRHVVDHLQHFQVLKLKEKKKSKNEHRKPDKLEIKNIMTTISVSCVERKVR